MDSDKGAPVALVTGASGGIGSVLCAQLREQGYSLVLFARHEERLAQLAGQLGEECLVVAGDAGIAADLERAVAAAMERWGRVDALAHCVGSIFLKPLHLTSEAEWSATLDLNLTSAFRAMRAVLPSMLRRRSGAIVCVSSVAGCTGLPQHEAIAAAKAGLIGLVRAAAMTYARRGMRINAVAPGLVQTPLAEPITSNEGALRASLAMHPQGRIGDPQEVAGAIAYLLSDRAASITGAVLPIDGGLAAGRGLSAG